ncbi:MAG: hypothetical protein GXO87_06860 [Chlorobi bacterium]|nr:hypothetical protein [Chlorobiota bacterium]
MRYTAILLFFALFISVTACSENAKEKSAPNNAASADSVLSTNGIHKAEIIKFVDVPEYTYIFVKSADKEFWLAVTTTKVQKGESIYFTKPLEMRDFHSSTLDTTFQSILFVSSIAHTADALTQAKNGKNAGMTGMVSPHGKMEGGGQGSQKGNKSPDVKVEKNAGETTVAEIFEKSEDLSGKEITLKGKITKFLPDIMGKNWLHIQDGTNFQGTGDLVATTKESFNVGDVVTIKAKLETNIDYGYGYKYNVILQDAVKVK